MCSVGRNQWWEKKHCVNEINLIRLPTGLSLLKSDTDCIKECKTSPGFKLMYTDFQSFEDFFDAYYYNSYQSIQISGALLLADEIKFIF